MRGLLLTVLLVASLVGPMTCESTNTLANVTDAPPQPPNVTDAPPQPRPTDTPTPTPTSSPTTTVTPPKPPVTTTTTATPSTPTPTSSTTHAPTTAPTTVKPQPQPSDRKFDAFSFIGGFALAIGLVAIGFLAWKLYVSRRENLYHTL